MQWRRDGLSPVRHRRRRRHRLTAVLGPVLALAVIMVVVIVAFPRAGPPTTARVPVARRTTVPVHRVTKSTSGNVSLPPLVATTTTPLKVLEIGDSLGIDLGDQLQSQLDATGIVTTTMASLGDSGLANVSFYDWPAELAGLLAADHPQVVVVFLGANDDQGLYVDGTAAQPGTADWDTAYAGRVDEILSESQGAGARVVWVGMPPMGDPDLDAAMVTENAIFERQTDSFAGTLYVSSTSVLGNASGDYEAGITDASGQSVELRTPDGVHLTPAGAGLLAGVVIDAFDSRWHLSLERPPSTTTTTTWTTTTTTTTTRTTPTTTGATTPVSS
jgi:uncharacterized protein